MKKITTIALSIVASLVVGCGGSDSTTTPTTSNTDTTLPTTNVSTITGQFIDSAVEGLDYSCGDMSGTTNSNGDFTCEVGKTVTFKLGDYTIGSAVASQTMTPVTLHPTDTKAQENTLRLLQTLDNDGNPANGINLNTELIKLLKTDSLAINSIDFESMASVLGGKVLVSAEDAKAHFEGQNTEKTNLFTSDIISNGKEYYMYDNEVKSIDDISYIRFTDSMYLWGSYSDVKSDTPHETYTISADKKTMSFIVLDDDEAKEMGKLPYTVTFKILEKTDAYTKLSSNSEPYGDSVVYFYSSKDKVAENFDSVQENAPMITVTSGFTQEWLDGRTLWSISFENVHDTSTKHFSEISYTNNQATYTIEENKTVNYLLTSTGIINQIEENGNEYYKVSAINGTKLTMCYSESLSEVENCTIGDEYYFTNKEDAQTYFDSL
jgi:hypothetical protein